MTNTNLTTSRWKPVAMGLALILVGLVIWDGADRRASDATQPLAHQSSKENRETPLQSLKLVSFNIHGGKGTDGVRSLPRIAELLSDFDYAGLYEVRATSSAESGNQAARLAGYSKAGWLFAPTERQWWSDHFGNGLIHHVPLSAPIRLPLVNTRGKAYRNAMLTTVKLQNSNVRIISVHIDRESDRPGQLATIIDLFLGLQKPCVLMGDLNTIAADPLLAGLMERPDVANPLQEHLAGDLPSQNIDWIFTRGLRTISARLIKNDASDHPLLWAEVVPDE